ncbi:MAG: LapA family protein [Gammaproteobacteria bacterium]|jgi:uncharacterized integral membrane protein|nr:LapA family protein [Gammaproteobacteria bacterium]
MMTTKNNVKLIISLILVVLLVVFIVQNAAVVELHFLFWTLSMSRSLMILFVLFIGLLVGWIVGSQFHHKPSTDENQANQPNSK